MARNGKRSEVPTKIGTTKRLEIVGTGPDDDTILISDEFDNSISIPSDLALQLAYLLMSLAKGQGSFTTHHLPKKARKDST